MCVAFVFIIHGKVSEEEMRELLAMEGDLSVEEILLYRGVAR